MQSVFWLSFRLVAGFVGCILHTVISSTVAAITFIRKNQSRVISSYD